VNRRASIHSNHNRQKEVEMNSSSSRPTSFVQEANMVENLRSQITAKLRGLPRVDHNGREITTLDAPVIPAQLGEQS
jgi:hypothetical protein